MQSLASSNPLEDFARLLVKPLGFSARLARDESATTDFPLAKAMGFYLFLSALVSIAGLVPTATLTADILGMISESLRPLYEQLGLHSTDVSFFESLAFFGVRLGGELMVFTQVLRNFCGLLLLAGLMSLVWPHLGFRRLMVWAAYSHWFIVLGLVVESDLLIAALATLFLSRVMLEAEADLGWGKLLRRWVSVSSLAFLVSVVGLSLT